MVAKPDLSLLPLGSSLTASVLFAHCVTTAGLNLSLYTVWKGKLVYKAVAVDKAAFLPSHTCSHMRLMPAHLAFIFVAKEYLNSAESKNGFVVLGPGGRDVAHRTRNSESMLISSYSAFHP